MRMQAVAARTLAVILQNIEKAIFFLSIWQTLSNRKVGSQRDA